MFTDLYLIDNLVCPCLSLGVCATSCLTSLCHLRCVLVTSDLFLLCSPVFPLPLSPLSVYFVSAHQPLCLLVPSGLPSFLVLSQCRFSWLVPCSVWFSYFCSVSQSAGINGSPSPPHLGFPAPHDLLAAGLTYTATQCCFMLGSLKLTSTYYVKGLYYQLGGVG